MKTILLSFNPKYYEPLKNGIKKYEYRSRFADEEIKAYLYLSAPVKKIVAIIYFGKRILLEKMKIEYAENESVSQRIEEYICTYNKKYAIPIYRIEFIEPISLQYIRETLPEFMPPQSYLIVKKDSNLETILKLAKPTGQQIVIDHKSIVPDDICVN